MSYKGTVRGSVIELDEGSMLPDGIRVSITPQEPITEGRPTVLKEWLEEFAWFGRNSPRAVIQQKSCDICGKGAPSGELHRRAAWMRVLDSRRTFVQARGG
jgi:hypothetical protein